MRLSWIRRARIEADAWQAREIPLDEPAEAYSVEILDSEGLVVRALEAARPSLFYAPADEIADFGVAQSGLTVRVAQVGEVYGPGAWLRETVPVRAA